METIQVSNYVIIVLKVCAVLTSVAYYVTQYEEEAGSGEFGSAI